MNTKEMVNAKTVAIHEVEGVLIDMNARLVERGADEKDFDLVLEVVNEIVERISESKYI